MLRRALLLALLPACVVGQEPDVPDDPEQRAIERVLSSPAPAPRPEEATVALNDDFPWLADLLPPPEAGDPDAGDDLGLRHLSLAVHGDGHDAREHLQRALAAFDDTLVSDADDGDALFGRFLARLLQGDAQAWRAAALELVRDAPMNPGIPYVYLAFAEVSLDGGKPKDAISFLERVVTFADPHARAFAFHDLGWAYLQSSPPDHTEALAAFVNAIKESQRPDSKLARSGAALRLAARRDLVTPFAAVGDPDKAQAFFTHVGRGPGKEDHVDEMLRLLAAAKK